MTSGGARGVVALAWLGAIVTACGGWVDLEPPERGKTLVTVDAAGKEMGVSGTPSSPPPIDGRGSGAVTSVPAAAGAGGEIISEGGASPGGTEPPGGSSPIAGSGGAPSNGPLRSGSFKILVLSTALEFAHDSIADCQRMLSELGATPDELMPEGTQPGSQFTTQIEGDDLADFTPTALQNYGLIFSCNPTGRVFSGNPKVKDPKGAMQAFQDFIEKDGNAFAGVHSASDFEKTNGFPWFTDTLMGAYFDTHDGDGTLGTVEVNAEFALHPVMRGVPPTWATQDEWYYMNRDVGMQPGFQVLATLAVDDRPVVWVKELAPNQGRMFYTIRGHNPSVYREPELRHLVLNGILWATHRLQ